MMRTINPHVYQNSTGDWEKTHKGLRNDTELSLETQKSSLKHNVFEAQCHIWGCVFNHLTILWQYGRGNFLVHPQMVIHGDPCSEPLGLSASVPVTGLQGTQQAEDILPQVTLDLHLRG